ncbi:MAG TPA: serine hydrolase [Chloroflexota bacterium]
MLIAVLVVRHVHQPTGSPPASVPALTVTTQSSLTETATASTTTSTNGALDPLNTSIAALTAPLQGTYGVWVEDIPTGANTSQHAQQQFVAASVIKFCILVALYEESARGQLSLDDQLTTSAADIQNYGTGSIRYDPVGTSYTLADLAQRAAKQSDNTAAYLIKQRLGEQYIQDRTAAWGLTDTSIAQDRTTPQDIGTLFAQLAQRRVLPAPSALDLLGLLTDTDFEDRLPALLPAYAIVAHKIGTEANGVLNDAGLVVLPTRSYVIVVMTDSANPDQAITAEQQISQAAFQFESTLP